MSFLQIRSKYETLLNVMYYFYHLYFHQDNICHILLPLVYHGFKSFLTERGHQQNLLIILIKQISFIYHISAFTVKLMLISSSAVMNQLPYLCVYNVSESNVNPDLLA